MTGHEVAESFLAWEHVTGVKIEEGPNTYSPLEKIITLQSTVYHGNSAAAATVAAHEAAHAVQHAERYMPARLHIILATAAFIALPIMVMLVALTFWHHDRGYVTWAILCASVSIVTEINRGVIEADAWERAREFLSKAGITYDDVLAKWALRTYIFGTACAMAKLALRRGGRKL